MIDLGSTALAMGAAAENETRFIMAEIPDVGLDIGAFVLTSGEGDLDFVNDPNGVICAQKQFVDFRWITGCPRGQI